MQSGLSHLLNVRQMPTGRRIFILRTIRREADNLGEAAIVARCDEAIAEDLKTMDLELGYQRAKGQSSEARGEARLYDQQIDAHLGSMEAIAEANTVGKPDDPVVVTAREFLGEVFPLGLSAMIRMSYEAQLTAMVKLLERFNDPADLAGHVDRLGLRRHVDQLGPLVDHFRAELQKEKYEQVTFDQLEAARATGRDLLAGVVFLVLATFYKQTGADAARRNRLLSELYRQDRLLARTYLRGRDVTDIDPNTGEPLAVDDEPVADPAIIELVA